MCLGRRSRSSSVSWCYTSLLSCKLHGSLGIPGEATVAILYRRSERGTALLVEYVA